MPKINDLTGAMFGNWKVLCKDDSMYRLKGYGTWWKCECQCEKRTLRSVEASVLKREYSTHCGCQLKSLGISYSTIYKIYSDIKQRCYNPKNSGYPYYGARGIKMCDRWEESFKNFYEDMGNIPFDGATIDRIDSSKNYGPDNCRWASREEQSRNRPTFNHIKNKEQADEIREEFRTTGKSRAQIAREIGVQPNVIEAIIKDETWT